MRENLTHGSVRGRRKQGTHPPSTPSTSGLDTCATAPAAYSTDVGASHVNCASIALDKMEQHFPDIHPGYSCLGNSIPSGQAFLFVRHWTTDYRLGRE